MEDEGKRVFGAVQGVDAVQIILLQKLIPLYSLETPKRGVSKPIPMIAQINLLKSWDKKCTISRPCARTPPL